MSSWRKTEFVTFPAALNNHYPHQAACHPNRPVRGQVRRLRWLTPGKLLPDKIERKEGEWWKRQDASGAGKQTEGVVEEEVGWGRWVLLRRKVWKEGKSSKTKGKGTGGMWWHMKRGRERREGRWRIRDSVCHWHWQALMLKHLV